MESIQQSVCLLLAFQTVVTRDEKLTSGVKKQILKLAASMNEFCDLELRNAFPNAPTKLTDDKRAAEIDATISIHRMDMNEGATCQLSHDRETLTQLYDRLQLRKLRRAQWQFYARASEEKLKELIQSLLAEENEFANGGRDVD